jgi:hypothetical protein
MGAFYDYFSTDKWLSFWPLSAAMRLTRQPLTDEVTCDGGTLVQ